MNKYVMMFVMVFVMSTIFSGMAVADRSGEIVDVQITPEFLESGQPMTISVDIKNTGTERTCYETHLSGNEHERWVYAGDTETETFTGVADEAGDCIWSIWLYWDAQWPNSNVLLDTVTVNQRCFSSEELGDPDNDNLMTYIENEELGTDPSLADTDGDGKRDDEDERPTIPEGSISISTTPSGASVRMDGKNVGTTPLSMKDVISEAHNLVFSKDGYRSKTVQFVLGTGGAENINEVLEQLTGSIRVTSDPAGADIYIDGVPEGNTPQTISDVIPGSYTVRLMKQYYNDYTESDVIVEAEQTESVNAVLVPSDVIPPSIRIDTTIIDHNYNNVLENGESIKIDYGANDDSGVRSVKIFLDGEVIASQNAGGDYSVDSPELSVGKHTIEVEAIDTRDNSGHEKKQITVELNGPSINFVGTRTNIKKGEDAIFSLSVANPLGNPLMEVQLMIKPPSDVSVTSSRFAKTGAGIYTCTQKIRSGVDARSIEVRLTSNQVGTHEIASEIYYQFDGGSKSLAKYDVLTLVVNDDVPETNNIHKTDNLQSKVTDTIPGFGVLATIIAFVVCVIFKRW